MAKSDLFPREKRLVPAILLVAAILRFGFVLLTSGTPVFDKYFWLARKLVGVHWFPREVFSDCPLYIYILGVLHAVLGLEETAIRLVQAAVSTVTVYLAWWSARQLAGPRPAVVTAALMAAHPVLVLYDTQPLPFPWVNLANAAALAAVLRVRLGGRAGWAMGAGVALGLSALLRPNILLWLPFLLLSIVLAEDGVWAARGLRRSAALLVAAAVTIAPITAINTFGGGEFTLVPASGGPVVYAGNKPGGGPIGYSEPPLVQEVQANILGFATKQPITPEHLAYRRVAEWIVGRKLSPSEASRFWTGESLAYLRRSPGAFMANLVAKLRHFFNGYEPHDTESAIVRGGRFALPGTAVFVAAWTLALFGVVATRASWRAFLPLYGLVAVYVATGVLAYVSSRLRLPAFLPAAIFAGAGAAALGDLARSRRWRLFAASGALAAALAVFMAWPTRAVREHAIVSTVWSRYSEPAQRLFLKGEREEALRLFGEALSASPPAADGIERFLEPYSQDQRVQRFLERTRRSPGERAGGDPVEAVKWRGVEKFLRKDWAGAAADFGYVLERRPYDWDMYYSRARARQELGQWRGALADGERSFEYGKKFETGLHRLYYELAGLAFMAGEEGTAREYVRRSLFVQPGFAPAVQLQAELDGR
jgi:4-amino-4-deoxy-L-arabinose transferase-like glycosyltransferase